MIVLMALAVPTSRALNTTGVFVHLFEWSWEDIATECEDFLGPKGYTAVQVSPPTEHLLGEPWWTRYQPVDYTSLKSRSGDAASFQSMINRCERVGVSIIVDAVINHLAAGTGTGTDGSTFGSRSFPKFSQQDFHHVDGDMSRNCGVDNYNDRYNVQNCDLVGLTDFDTSSTYVQDQIVDYIETMAALGVAGVRIDAAKHIAASELKQILSRISIYNFMEVIGSAGEAVSVGEYFDIGDVTEFDYAQQLSPNILQDGKMQYLHNFGEAFGLMPPSKAVVFIDNHDTQRSIQKKSSALITYKSGEIYTFANIFMLAHDYGFPKVMSSFYFDSDDQGPPSAPAGESTCMDGRNWVCEHRYGPIANMVAWRNIAGSAPVESFVADGPNTVAFGRGGRAWIAMNRGGGVWHVSALATGLPAGTYCNIIISNDASSCPQVVVDAGGFACNFRVGALSAVALHAGAMVL